ncbi:MAG: GNAT family N-acetyltransferase [Bryobacteraceae bacterium]
MAGPERTTFNSSDLSLAYRLEAAESANIIALASALGHGYPEAAFQPFAGGTAVFAGVDSPMTHALGIGLGGPVPEPEMEAMENFFRNRGSACLIDLCPMADPSVVAFVQSRPYRVVEFNNVLARRIDRGEMFQRSPGIRPAAGADLSTWARVVAEGFSENIPLNDEAVKHMAATFAAGQCWLAGTAESDPIGGAGMGIQNGVALFWGDSILLSARRKGWQSALIAERLEAARQQACDLAMVSVLPGGGSHRNYERADFQLIYMRVNLKRDFA